MQSFIKANFVHNLIPKEKGLNKISIKIARFEKLIGLCRYLLMEKLTRELDEFVWCVDIARQR